MSKIADYYYEGQPAPPTYPASPGFKTGGTSRDAARAIAGGVEQIRCDIHAELKRSPGTADEIAERLGLKVAYVAPRLSEMATPEDGRAVKTAERRRSKTSEQSRAVYYAAEEDR